MEGEGLHSLIVHTPVGFLPSVALASTSAPIIPDGNNSPYVE